MLRRPRTSSQHATRGGHSDDDEDEGVPVSYHTVSLQVSQDVSMAPFTSSSLPAPGFGSVERFPSVCLLLAGMWASCRFVSGHPGSLPRRLRCEGPG